MQTTKSSLITLLSMVILIAAVPLAGRSAGSASEKVIYNFRGGSDGANPAGGLVVDKAGNLYGTTSEGGSFLCSAGCGVVFELTPPAPRGSSWSETVLYRFTGGSDGAAPESNLTFDAAGNLYGTTAGGGDASSDGTVFQLTPPSTQGGAWAETVLYRFSGGSDGKNPVAGLIFDHAGSFYVILGKGGRALWHDVGWRLIREGHSVHGCAVAADRRLVLSTGRPVLARVGVFLSSRRARSLSSIGA